MYGIDDALGSVRQITNPDGHIVLAKAYDPYGVNNLNNGTASTNYGFTGEHTEPTGDIYLRARHYSPGVGRFITRDTWDGVDHLPMSFNRWNYVNANPVNLTDPTGNNPMEECRVLFPEDLAVEMALVPLGVIPALTGMCIVEKIMHPKAGDYLNTYTAAGVAIESNFYDPWVDTRGGLYWRFEPFDYYHSGLGICNISDAQMDTAFGEKIIENGEPNGHYGLGLRYFDQEYPQTAVVAMKMRLLLVIEPCTDCSVTDIFIASALARGSNLFPSDIKILKTEYRIKPSSPNGMTFNWALYFTRNNSRSLSSRHLRMFQTNVQELQRRSADWTVPDVNWEEINIIINRAGS